LNIIDTLSAGFATVAKRLWLLILPVALDVFLWLGPKLSIAPVIEKMVSSFRAAMQTMPPAAGADVNFTQMFDAMVDSLQNVIGRTNLLSLLAWNNMGVPSIAGGRPVNPVTDHVLQITGYGQMLLLQALIMIVGLFIACVFWGLLAQAVRGEPLDVPKLLGHAPAYWLYLLVILVPLGLVLVAVVSFSILLGPFAPFIWVTVLWTVFLVSFVPQAVTLGEEKPLRALWASLTIVRRNFWAALGLVLLTAVIDTGLGMVWQFLMASRPGMALAIIANAFIGTGLTAATFVFFSDRMARLQEAMKSLRSA
jgi:hypothetical protein